MANEDNLIPVRSESEAREKGRKGGFASGEARRRKKDLRECLKALLDEEDMEGTTGSEKLAMMLYMKAMEGNVKAYSELRDTVYGKPVSTIEMTGKGGTPLQPPSLEVVFTKNNEDKN